MSYFQSYEVIITRIITQFSSIARGCLSISQAFISIHSRKAPGITRKKLRKNMQTVADIR